MKAPLIRKKIDKPKKCSVVGESDKGTVTTVQMKLRVDEEPERRCLDEPVGLHRPYPYSRNSDKSFGEEEQSVRVESLRYMLVRGNLRACI